MQMTRFVFFRLEKHFNDDSIKPTNLRHFMSLLYQRSYFYYTQITKNFKRNTLSDNTADFSHQRYGPRNQPQDNERIPDPIRQCIVTVIPVSYTHLEVAFKCFIRFVLAQAAVTYDMELMTALFSIAQGAIQTIMGASGLSATEASTLPAEIASTIEDVGLLESIPLWAVTLLGSLFIWVLSLVMILTVYGREL